MLHRFCKLCYRAVDESVLKSRRYSVEYLKAPSEFFNDEETEKYPREEEPEENEKPVKNKRPCIIKCKISRFDFYEGDTYPKFQPIPLASRGWHHRKSKGDYFTILPVNMEYDKDNNYYQGIDSSLKFRDIDIDKRLVENLEANDIIHPTKIQKLGIPRILNGQNVILTAETGCGKTFAFLVPILHQILRWKYQKDRGVNSPLGIILTPSRELAVQITREARKLLKNLDVKVVNLTGGSKKIFFNPPISEVDLVVGTLGVINTLVKNGSYKMDQVRHVVLDEADTLFDETFRGLLCKFLRNIPIGTANNQGEIYPSYAQLTLNSATIPEEVSNTLYGVVDTNSLETVTTGFEHRIGVPQKFMRLGGSEKPQALLKLIKPKVKNKIPTIIFSNTTETCDFTSIFLKNFNIKCLNLHSNMPMVYRRKKFSEFQNGLCSVLTTTDAGARGLDTTLVKDVINYDFPLITAEYIHRCGRIGRIGSPRDCRVINFISKPLEIVLTSKIEFATRKMKSIPMVDLIHTNEDNEGEFLRPDTKSEDYTEQKSEGGDVDDESEERYRIPQ